MVLLEQIGLLVVTPYAGANVQAVELGQAYDYVEEVADMIQ
jgi:hypothetical protein